MDGAPNVTRCWAVSHSIQPCVCGGERLQRHNALRDLLHWWLDVAGFKPEKEKLMFLHLQRLGDSAAARRPADIFLPTYAGSPTALGLAVTAPLRLERVAAKAGQQRLPLCPAQRSKLK